MKKSFLQVFKNPILLVIIGLSSAVVSSCTYDKQDKSYGKNSCDTNQLSYVQIQDKFEQQCFACHTASAPSGNVAIYDYPSLKTYITNAKNIFLGSINHTTASPMPKGGQKWDACTIQKVEAWINQGMKP
jgi:hypothetical protein